MLTREDIESLGFELNENTNWFHKEDITIAAANIIYGHSSAIQIWKATPKTKTDLLLFQGCVKNKSELVVLLDQVDTRVKEELNMLNPI